MEILIAVVALIFGIIIGAVIAFLLSRHKPERVRLELENERAVLETQLQSANTSNQQHLDHISDLQEKLEQRVVHINAVTSENASLSARIESERQTSEEKLKTLVEAQDSLKDAFSSLSLKALQQNTEAFAQTAEQVLKSYQEKASGDLEERQKNIKSLVEPVKEQLEKVSEYVREVEKSREGAYAELKQQFTQMSESQGELRNTASQLVKVLGNTKSRGQWGEIQLKRVVELAGMTAYCDFEEQHHVQTEQGSQRPDLIVRLPADRLIVIDAKAPMDAFLSAHESETESERTQLFKNHAASLRKHVNALKSKAYQDNYDQSPEFVILFLPNESVYSTALEFDRTLIEDGARENVIIATPTTLIALLKAVAYGWRQEKIADEVKKFSALGKEFYERLATVTGHITGLGKSLNGTVQNYNKMVGSIDKRLIPTARKFHDSSIVGESKKSLDELESIEHTVRPLDDMKSLDSPSQIEEDLEGIAEDFEAEFGKLRIAEAGGGRD